ncbi:MAG: hypothetical protein IPP44_12210 [Ideonella sp.]|nr:hypothetical protein [Ideonella sp.]
MAKTPDQRVKELKSNVTWVVANVWDTETAKVRRDLDASAYKTIAGLAKRFDAVQDKFREGIEKQDKSKDLADKPGGDLSKMNQQIEALFKTLDGLRAEAGATVKSKSGDGIDDLISYWEESLKTNQAITKESKACFDQLSKLYETYDKLVADTIGKVRAQADAAKSEMSRANNELNALEAQIRSAVINCEAAAIKQNKLDVAKAVKAVLKVFGGK